LNGLPGVIGIDPPYQPVAPEVRNGTSDNEFYDGTMYRIRVDRAFRGNLGNAAEIFSENSSGSFPMTVGAKYLLFIYTASGPMQVDYCGNSGLLSKRRKELQLVERLATN
jgi:hypothetical protein